MPIETDTRRWTYTGDGSSTQFAYDALAFEQSNLTVRVAGVLQVFSVDYSVTGLLASDGGNVVFVSAPANGAAIEIVRTVPPRQPVDLPSAGALPAEVIMRMVDRTVAALIDRFGVVVDMRPDASATLTSLLLPDPDPGALIGWDGTAGALQNLVVNDGSVLPALLGSLTAGEINQLLNINATTISAAQWGYLGAMTAQPAESAGLRRITMFLASGAYPKPSWLRFARVCVWAGGGGGGMGFAPSGTCGSGGGGGYAERLLADSEIVASETVTIGAGGAGGSGAAPSAGATGGTSSFGSLVSATGGGGGSSTGAAGAAGGAGGIGIGGQDNRIGGRGTNGSTIRVVLGGDAPRGGQGGRGIGTTGSGGGSQSGQAPGGGGSSGITETGLGGAGAAGLVIIYEYE